jgi:hypothetical protein
VGACLLPVLPTVTNVGQLMLNVGLDWIEPLGLWAVRAQRARVLVDRLTTLIVRRFS